MSKRREHSWPAWATCCRGIPHCAKCGMLWLRNAVTRKALAKPCPGADDTE